MLSVMMGNLSHDDNRDSLFIYDHKIVRHFTPPGMAITISLPCLCFHLDFFGSPSLIFLLSLTSLHLSIRQDSARETHMSLSI